MIRLWSDPLCLCHGRVDVTSNNLPLNN